VAPRPDPTAFAPDREQPTAPRAESTPPRADTRRVRVASADAARLAELHVDRDAGVAIEGVHRRRRVQSHTGAASGAGSAGEGHESSALAASDGDTEGHRREIRSRRGRPNKKHKLIPRRKRNGDAVSPKLPDHLLEHTFGVGDVQQVENPLPIGRLTEGDYTRQLLRESLTKKPGAPAKLPTLPGVDSISLATRYMVGGRDQFVELMQHAMLNNDPLAVKWWAVYADLAPYPRSIVSFDDVTAAAGVEPAALCGMLVSTAMRLGRDVANMVAALSHPKVLQAQIESATNPDPKHPEIAFKDRIAMLQAAGLNVVPKGAVIVNVNATANATAAAGAQASAGQPTVPSFAEDLNLFSGARPALPTADPQLEPIDAVIVPAGVPAD